MFATMSLVAGPRPSTAESWEPLGDEAGAWESQGFGPIEARLWRLLALTPAEAAQRREEGEEPADLIQESWDAGVPLD